MGVFKLLSGGSTPPPTGNPDPFNFIVMESKRVGDLWVVRAKYPGCTNYEGEKVMLLQNDPEKLQFLDPHFMENGPVVARFAPTYAGWSQATLLAENLLRIKKDQEQV